MYIYTNFSFHISLFCHMDAVTDDAKLVSQSVLGAQEVAGATMAKLKPNTNESLQPKRIGLSMTGPV